MMIGHRCLSELQMKIEWELMWIPNEGSYVFTDARI